MASLFFGVRWLLDQKVSTTADEIKLSAENLSAEDAAALASIDTSIMQKTLALEQQKAELSKLKYDKPEDYKKLAEYSAKDL